MKNIIKAEDYRKKIIKLNIILKTNFILFRDLKSFKLIN